MTDKEFYQAVYLTMIAQGSAQCQARDAAKSAVEASRQI